MMKYKHLALLFLVFSCSGEVEKKEKKAVITIPVVIEKIITKAPEKVEKICPKPGYKKADKKILWNIGKQQRMIEKLIKESRKEPKEIIKTIYEKCPAPLELPKTEKKPKISKMLMKRGMKLDTHYGADNKCKGWAWVIREGKYDHYYFVDCKGNYVEQLIERG